MKIFVTGAYGFIGTQVANTLAAAGHTVVCGVRDITLARRLLPDFELVACNFACDTDSNIWLPRLKDIDVVVNCVGILQTHQSKTIEAIHDKTPRAIVNACQKAQVKKFIHISAIGADKEVQTAYAQTKWQFEQYLKHKEYNWVILRPSLIYSTGSYGGTSLFRALSAMPWIIPIVGQGKQLFQPISMSDLTQTIQICAENEHISQQIISVVGPEKISITELFIKLRKWLGFGKAIIFHIPLGFIRLGAFLGDWFKDVPINSTVYKMLSHDNIADFNSFVKLIGFSPSKMDDNLLRHPSSIEDRWYARLYFLNPLLRITLAVFWVFSGLIPLFFANPEVFDNILYKINITDHFAKIAFYITTLVNVLLGLLTLANWKIKWIGFLQIILLIFYPVLMTVVMPEYWLDPFAALLKDIPLVIATLIMMAVSEQR